MLPPEENFSFFAWQWCIFVHSGRLFSQTVLLCHYVPYPSRADLVDNGRYLKQVAQLSQRDRATP